MGLGVAVVEPEAVVEVGPVPAHVVVAGGQAHVVRMVRAPQG